MSEEILTTIILAVQGVIVAFIGLISVRLNSVKRSTESVQEQVENTHTSNLRDDLDDKHDELYKEIKRVDVRTSKYLEDLSDRMTNQDQRFNGINSRLDILGTLIINNMEENDG